MAFLRLGSTRRVVGLLLGAAAVLVVLAVVAGSALGGGGEAPPAKTLPQAIHDALSAPKVDGVTANVSFTSHLFDGATTDTSSALLKGGNGRLWAAPGKFRLELQSDNGDAQIVVADGKGFIYDGPSNTAYTFAAQGHAKQKDNSAGSDSIPTIAQIEQQITKAEQNATIGGLQPEVVGGQPAYQVRVSPKQQGGLLGAAELAWDAARGVPLKLALYARGASTPAVELSVSDIAYGGVDPSVFDISPPPDAQVVDLGGGKNGATAGAGRTEQQQQPSFPANAPAALGPRAHRQTKPAGDGYLVLYGKGLDTVAVLEHKAKPGEKPAALPGGGGGDGQDGQSLQLPTTSINGAKATAFGTPLGGVVMFQRDGISYVVAGSQPLSVLEDAARSL